MTGLLAPVVNEDDGSMVMNFQFLDYNLNLE